MGTDMGMEATEAMEATGAMGTMDSGMAVLMEALAEAFRRVQHKPAPLVHRLEALRIPMQKLGKSSCNKTRRINWGA